jgi:hypothetical protein
MKTIPLWSAGDKPEQLGTVDVHFINNMPPELIAYEGKQFVRAYYGGWCYDEISVIAV